MNGNLLEFIFQIAVEFGATFFGVIYAFRLSYDHERRKREQETTELAINILSSIKKELENILHPINRYIMGYTYSTIWLVFTSDAFNSAIGGGYYSLLSHESQARITSIYTKFKQGENCISKIYSMIGTPSMAMTGATQTLNQFKASLDSIIGDLREEIPTLIEYLEIELKTLEQQTE